MRTGKALYERQELNRGSANKATKDRIDTEFKIFKDLYFKLIVSKSLSKKELISQIQGHFKGQKLKMGRSKFFAFQNKIAEEDLKKDWWVTKRKKEIEERNERLRKLGAKEIRMIAIDSKGENLEDFIDKKSKAIEEGIKRGSKQGGKSTKRKFI